ncbi:MAG: hypothetical protein HN597_18495, partial [Desulfobacula sp.]|uniref:hypothetical protein n=1 Tax=Desulfobacula sp. TaxID=2593537 RepID=UPI0039B94C39|nr:hypothetical protein [Desulfobacula sp.]
MHLITLSSVHIAKAIETPDSITQEPESQPELLIDENDSEFSLEVDEDEDPFADDEPVMLPENGLVKGEKINQEEEA